MRLILEQSAWRRYMLAELLLTKEGATVRVARAYAKAYIAAEFVGLHRLAEESAKRAHRVRELL